MSANSRASAFWPGQVLRVARLRHPDAAQHLAHDHLDVLVVDRHALLAVHLLHLVAEVLLGLADALDLEDLLRVDRRLRVAGELLPGHDLDTVGDPREEVGATGDDVRLLGAVVGERR